MCTNNKTKERIFICVKQAASAIVSASHVCLRGFVKVFTSLDLVHAQTRFGYVFCFGAAAIDTSIYINLISMELKIMCFLLHFDFPSISSSPIRHLFIGFSILFGLINLKQSCIWALLSVIAVRRINIVASIKSCARHTN